MISIYTVVYKVLDQGPHYQLLVHTSNDRQGAEKQFFDKIMGQKQWITVEEILETKNKE